jgi:hypothetical protein
MTPIAALLAATLAAPAPEPAPPPKADDVSLGIGWVVSRAGTAAAQYAADVEPATVEPPPADPEAEAESTRPKAPPPRVRPFAHRSDLDDRIREARRARAIMAGLAGAVMGATAIYGIIRAVEAQDEMEQIRNAPRRSQYNPMHPR